MAMSDDDEPRIHVQSSGIDITVTDRMSAEAALPVIDGVLEHYLGPQDNPTPRPRRQHEPVPVKCQKCGYEWEYQGENPRGATCPDCHKHTTFEPTLTERGVR